MEQVFAQNKLDAIFPLVENWQKNLNILSNFESQLFVLRHTGLMLEHLLYSHGFHMCG